MIGYWHCRYCRLKLGEIDMDDIVFVNLYNLEVEDAGFIVRRMLHGDVVCPKCNTKNYFHINEKTVEYFYNNKKR